MRLVPIARVGSPHGVKGWLRAISLTSEPELFQNISEVFVGPTTESSKKYELADAGTGTRGIRLKFSGVDSRESAAELSGHYVFIPEKELPPIEEEDTYYAYQLVGLRVEDENGSEMGRIDDIFSTGSNDVFIVKGKNEAERYLPALKTAIKKVDLKNGLVTVDSSWLI